VTTRLSIGEFSHLTHLSVRTLRRYHDAELLIPATVDDTTGYRYYSADQIPTAQVIHRLRELDVPLADVRRILDSGDHASRSELVSGFSSAWSPNSIAHARRYGRYVASWPPNRRR
jgi:DNA-binding transcriptional MerR regulator